MIDLCAAAMPNGRMISIALKELGLDDRVRKVDPGSGEQFAPKFLTVSPNNKTRAIVGAQEPDGAPLAPFDSDLSRRRLLDRRYHGVSVGERQPAGRRT